MITSPIVPTSPPRQLGPGPAVDEGGPHRRTEREGRVEMWRGGVGRAYPLAGPFVRRCLTSPPVPRFHIPLIEPDVRFSRIRLSFRISGLGIQHGFATRWQLE